MLLGSTAHMQLLFEHKHEYYQPSTPYSVEVILVFQSDP